MSRKLLCICPNPSIDISVHSDSILIGGLNRVNNPSVTFSGKGVNVAKAFSILGYKSTCGGFMFSETTSAFEKNLLEYDIFPAFTQVPGRVRTNIKLCESGGQLTEINASGNKVSNEDKDRLLSQIQKMSVDFDATVISGSLPLGCNAEFYGELSKSINSKLKIIDTSGMGLLMALRYGADLIKPNLTELEEITGSKICSADTLTEGIFALHNMGARIVIVSMGDKGAVVSDSKDILYAEAPNVKLSSSVGAGDSMLASATLSLLESRSLEELLIHAVAAGSAAVMSQGTSLFETTEYKKLCHKITVKRGI